MGLAEELVMQKIKDNASKREGDAIKDSYLLSLSQNKQLTPETEKVIKSLPSSLGKDLATTIKSMIPQLTETDSNRGAQTIETAQKPGGIEALIKANPAGLKATSGGASIEIPSSLDATIKASAKVAETNATQTAAAEKTAQGTYRFMNQFEKSYNELKGKYPEIDQVGASGWLTRQGAKIAEHLDELPETTALKIQIQPLANGMARDIEGGRVTDQDRKIYANSFASAINYPSKTNVRNMSSQLINLIDKGGNETGKITEHLKQLSKSNTDIMKSVISQVLIDFPEMAKDIYGKDYEVVDED